MNKKLYFMGKKVDENMTKDKPLDMIDNFVFTIKTREDIASIIIEWSSCLYAGKVE